MYFRIIRRSFREKGLISCIYILVIKNNGFGLILNLFSVSLYIIVIWCEPRNGLVRCFLITNDTLSLAFNFLHSHFPRQLATAKNRIFNVLKLYLKYYLKYKLQSCLFNLNRSIKILSSHLKSVPTYILSVTQCCHNKAE